jgi:hypothetical protein
VFGCCRAGLELLVVFGILAELRGSRPAGSFTKEPTI